MSSPSSTVDDLAFRAAMSRFPTFVSVITAPGRDGPVGCTATAVLSLSLHPPTMLVSLRTAGHTLAEIRSGGAFAVNALSLAQQGLPVRFATGDPRRRFDGVDHAWVDGVPVLRDAVATVVCELAEAVPALDHTLLLGTVTRTLRTPGEPLVLLDGAAHEAVPAA